MSYFKSYLRRAGPCNRQQQLLLLVLAVTMLQPPATAKVMCRLNMEGLGDKVGLKSVQMSCSGGFLKAAAHPMLAPFTRSFSGVQWVGTGTCGVLKRYCLLTFCGDSAVTFERTTVSHVNVSSAVPVLLCLAGRSSVVFQQARFHGNTGPCILMFQPNSNTTETLRLNQCVFTNNSYGALALAGGAARVESSTFIGNSVPQNGGAIYVSRTAKATLVSSLLQGNTAVDVGGAVYADGTSRLSLYNTTLRANKASFGGAVLLFEEASAEISNSNITGNAADKSGGGIYASDSARLNLSNSNLVGNTAVAHGGGIGLWQKAKLQLARSLLRDNVAEEYGGGISAGNVSSVRVWGSTFHKNSGAKHGGGLLACNASRVVIAQSTFSRNKVTGHGGAVGVLGSAVVRVDHCRFVNNTAKYAGAVDVQDSSRLHMVATELAGNNATMQGGALYSCSNSSVQVLNSNLESNTAQDSNGGALAIWDAAKVRMTNVRVAGNRAAYAGGINIQESASLHLINSTLVFNTAANSGGVINLWGNSSCSVVSCNVVHNSAGEDGGGIYAGEAAELSITGTVFSSNTAVRGGALFLMSANASANMQSCTFSDNMAKGFGGAMFFDGKTRATAKSCVFYDNTAGTIGGAIHLADSARILLSDARGVQNIANHGGFLGMEADTHAEVANGFFFQNRAALGKGGKGGTLHAYGSAVAVVRNCAVVGGLEQAGVSGGGFSLMGNATMHLSSCLLLLLHAENGGAFYVTDTSSMHVRNCSVFNATAVEWGGGIYAKSHGPITWLGGFFLHTRAKYGGAVFVVHGNMSLAGTLFQNSTASGGGGCVYVESAAVTIADCNLQGCTAVDDGGGALHITSNAVARLDGCNITQSRSMHFGGGALGIFQNADVHMHRCRLQHNQGHTAGGAIAAQDNTQLTAVGCHIANNTCAGKGGGLGVIGNASVQLIDCSVTGCFANKGGGMCLEGQATADLVGTTITHNAAASYGGGVLLGSDRFTVSQMKVAVRGNKAPFSSDLSILPTSLINMNSSTVDGYISRLRADEGLVNVTLLVTGTHDMPAAKVLVSAVLNDTVVHQQLSGEDGLVHMHVKVLKPPGAYTMKFFAPFNEQLPVVNVTFHVIECGIGDVTVSSGDACQTCNLGFYSFNPLNKTCDPCVPNAECGNSTILPVPSFWSSSPRSAQMHRCFNEEACPGGINKTRLEGGDDYKSSQCAPGYQGNLCALCAPGYGTAKAFTCRPCMAPAATIVLWSLAALVMLVVVRGLSALALADSGPVVPGQAQPIDLLKPLVVYGQYLFVIININSIPFPATLAKPAQAVGWFWSSASSNSLGLDCVLPRHAAIPVAMQKTLFSLLMPIAMLIMLLLGDAVFVLWQRRARSRVRRRFAASISMRDRFLSLSVCIAFIFLPTWAHAVFSLFACVPLDVPVAPPYSAAAAGVFLAQDMNTECFAPGSYHRAYALGLGLPLLVLVCFVLPVWLFLFMWLSNRRGLLVYDSFRQQYGFLYRSWRVCWWESVAVIQTTLLVMIGTFGYSLGVYYQLLVITAALGIIGVLLFLVQPHSSKLAGSVTLLSIAVLVTTAFSCLTFLPYNTATQAHGQYAMAMGVFVLVINIVFVLSTLWRLVRVMQWGWLGRLCSCCRARIAPCCPCCSCESCQQSRRNGQACLDAWHLPWLPHAGAGAAAAAAGRAWAAGCCGFKSQPALPPVESIKGLGGSLQPQVVVRGQHYLQQPLDAALPDC